MRRAAETEARRERVPLYERIYSVVRQIPAGKVATYGQIAAIVGSTGPRTVGYAMAALRTGDVPWQRVINRQGKISARASGGPDSRQRALLIEEGVLFDAQGRVSFQHSGWDGPDMDWLEDNGFYPATRPWVVR